MVWTSIPTNFHFAFDMNSHGVGELEGVEKGVSDHSGSRVSASHFHKLGNHFGPEHTPITVG